MSDPTSYRSSNQRITKRDENNQFVNNRILDTINGTDQRKDAETIWLELKKSGMTISIATFHAKLKKLIENGKVNKHAISYNRYEYWIDKK